MSVRLAPENNSHSKPPLYAVLVMMIHSFMDLLDHFESKYLVSLGRAEVDLSSTVQYSRQCLDVVARSIGGSRAGID